MTEMNGTNLEGCCRLAKVNIFACQNFDSGVNTSAMDTKINKSPYKRCGLVTLPSKYVSNNKAFFFMAYLQQSDVNSSVSKGSTSLSKTNTNFSKGNTRLTKSKSIKQVLHWVLGMCVGNWCTGPEWYVIFHRVLLHTLSRVLLPQQQSTYFKKF